MNMTTNDEFRNEIRIRTQPHVDRLNAFSARNPRPVHSFVIQAMENLIDLIGYHSDSTIDEYQNSIDPYIDAPDYAEEYASCGYPEDVCNDPDSADYRSMSSEIEEYFAVFNHLSDWEIAFLRDQSNIVSMVDEYDDISEPLVELFNAQMTKLEAL